MGDDGDDVEMGGIENLESDGQNGVNQNDAKQLGGSVVGKGKAKAIVEDDAPESMDLDQPLGRAVDGAQQMSIDGLEPKRSGIDAPTHTKEAPTLGVPGYETSGALYTTFLEAELQSAMDHPIDERAIVTPVVGTS